MDEKVICNNLNVDSAIIPEIRNYTSNKIERFHYSLSKMYEAGKETEVDPIYLKGLVLQEKNSESYNLVLNLKPVLKNKGYSVFLLENNFDIDHKNDLLGILKTIDKYEVLKQIGTNGGNYDITNDSLLKVIRVFDEKYQLDLIGASGDWCEFIIQSEPTNWFEFAGEVYKVCPDVVDQGTGTKEALAEEMKKTKRLYFWWD
ncbi:MAG TPA: DUF4253 domain-containing protein [Bacteroidia bacterium]|nr:DUF4253 domain-containing protein [Bacteroidia bacterium]